MCLSLVAAVPRAGDDDVEVETSPAENLHNSTEFNEEHHYYVDMMTLYNYLDTIENITAPGCSSDVLDMALESMSHIVANLSLLSSNRAT